MGLLTGWRKAQWVKLNNCCQILISFFFLKVRLEQEVVGIQWNEGGCSVTTRTGSTIHCQHAIVTIPLGVLQVSWTTLRTTFHTWSHYRQTTRAYSNQLWGEKFWRLWTTLGLEVWAKFSWDGTILGGKRERDLWGLQDQGVSCFIFFADMLLLFLCLPKSKFLRKEREGKRLPEDWIDHIPGFAEVSWDVMEIYKKDPTCQNINVYS